MKKYLKNEKKKKLRRISLLDVYYCQPLVVQPIKCRICISHQLGDTNGISLTIHTLTDFNGRGTVHTWLEKFKNGVFSPMVHHIFSIYAKPDQILKKASIISDLRFVSEATLSRKSHAYHDEMSSKSSVFIIFSFVRSKKQSHS